ncbi:MAG: sodium-dependent transporter [Candidatus Omnitrophica bacterium]|nr:sodium-dependent transporter [Candidatus Omnitrophota bacterium]
MSIPKLSEAHHPRPQWRSRMGFILAALGSAVGLGNIWRFSYLCHKNGGAAFLVPYFIALLIVGIPLLILELGIGHKMRGSAPMSFAKVDRKWEWCGWWAVNSAMYGIMIYYSVIIAWCLCYVFYSFNLSWGDDPNHFFFNEFLNKSTGPFVFGDMRTPIVLSLFAVWFFTWFIVYSGVQKGVERANKVFMPMLLGLITILVFWSLTLEGAQKGLSVYLKPDFLKLMDYKIWIDAFSQIFFTLSLAFGIMITYASYLPRKVDIVKDALIIGFGNCFFSLFAGLAVFGTLGYMAHTQGVAVSEVVEESLGLAFVTYPKAISLMPAFAKVFGVIFFSSLVIAGLSSAISLVEAFSCAVIDKFHYGRGTVVTVVCSSGFILSLFFTARSGLFWVDIVDHFITNYGLVIVGVLECVIVGWIFKASKMRDHINHAGRLPLPKIWDISVKFLVPLILIFLLVAGLKVEFSEPYEGYRPIELFTLGQNWLLLALFVSIIVAFRPWKRELEEKQDESKN